MSAIPWVGQDIVELINNTDSYTTVCHLLGILPNIGAVSIN